MFFFLRNSSPLFSITRPSSFSVIHVSVNVKNNAQTDTTLLLFFLSKSPGGHVISIQIKHSVAFGLPYLLIELRKLDETTSVIYLSLSQNCLPHVFFVLFKSGTTCFYERLHKRSAYIYSSFKPFQFYKHISSWTFIENATTQKSLLFTKLYYFFFVQKRKVRQLHFSFLSPRSLSPYKLCLVPRRFSFDENVRAKEGGKETTGETSGRSCFQDGGKSNGGRICSF